MSFLMKELNKSVCEYSNRFCDKDIDRNLIIIDDDDNVSEDKVLEVRYEEILSFEMGNPISHHSRSEHSSQGIQKKFKAGLNSSAIKQRKNENLPSFFQKQNDSPIIQLFPDLT